MKKHNVIEFILVGLLVCIAISCKSAGSENTAANDNTSLTDSANSNKVAVKKPLPTPYPAIACPSQTRYASAFQREELKKYEGCRLTIKGRLLVLKSTSVELVSEDARDASDDMLRDPLKYEKKTVSCSGDFSGDTYSQIGAKLDNLKQKEQFEKLPTVTFQGTVRTTQDTVSDELFTELKECVMTNFQK